MHDARSVYARWSIRDLAAAFRCLIPALAGIERREGFASVAFVHEDRLVRYVFHPIDDEITWHCPGVLCVQTRHGRPWVRISISACPLRGLDRGFLLKH